MHIEADPTPVGRGAAVARVRGGSVGTLSGGVSVAAHGWVSGGMALSGTALMLLVAACAVVGALTFGSALLRNSAAGLVSALIAGQALGHMSLTLAPGHGGHAGHGGLMPSTTMLLAHALATIAAALVVLGVEAAYRVGTAAVVRSLRFLLPMAISEDRAPLRTRHRDRIVLRVFPVEALRMRGPPMSAY